ARETEGVVRHPKVANRRVQRFHALWPLDLLCEALRLPTSRPASISSWEGRVSAAIGIGDMDGLAEIDRDRVKTKKLELVFVETAEVKSVSTEGRECPRRVVNVVLLGSHAFECPSEIGRS